MRTCAVLARLLTLALCALGFGALAISEVRAQAQDYPDKPIRFIVCFAAGGPNDITARLFSQYLSEHFNQQFVIENRPGAGGNLGMQAALASAADGYTIVFVGPNNFINPSIYSNMPFDFIRDAAPVAGTMKMTNILVVNPSSPHKTLADYIAFAKANPGKLNFASGGVGTSPHMSGELLKAMTGVNLLHVPYRGTAPALVDLLGGQVDSVFDNLPGPIGHVKAGKLRALGVADTKRVPQLPDVPTIAETLPGYECRLRHRHAEGDTARDRRQVQRGGERGAEEPEAAGPHRRARRRADADDVGRIQQARGRPDRQVGEGDQGSRHQAAVAGIRPAANRRPRSPEGRMAACGRRTLMQR
jgi:tripartite-type tricarboxylate transporter receptor subunit TctC